MIHEKLAHARKDLLDLSGRNRLLNTPRGRARSGRIDLVDELSEELFRLLVLEKRSLTFLPAPEETAADDASAKDTSADDPAERSPGLPQPEESGEEEGVAARHRDTQLQTRLTSEALQKKLLKTFYDARTFEEEQGVNILYLALGFLRWYDPDRPDSPRHAPLLLVPVELERRSANAKFRLRYTDDEVTTNLSLQEKLQSEFGVRLPDVPDTEDLSPNAYFAEVAQAVSAQPRWEVAPNDMTLWFFSFSKFLMYRDLDPEAWPEEHPLDNHPLIAALLEHGRFEQPAPERAVQEEVATLDLALVTDADSSQARAIAEVRRGRSLVIQGPPGTGKSQTITNLIADAVREGRKVLFVSEKMAALDVVKRRLDRLGLGDMCLELHSHKANKRSVIDDLGRTLALGRPKLDEIQPLAEELAACRDRLDGHAQAMHSPLEPSQRTPYRIYGELVRLRAKGCPMAPFALDAAPSWSAGETQRKRELVRDVAMRLHTLGAPEEHPWRGVRLPTVLPMDAERLTAALPEIMASLETLRTIAADLGQQLGYQQEPTFADATRWIRLTEMMAQAPSAPLEQLADDIWSDGRERIDGIIQQGLALSGCRERLKGIVTQTAWSTDVWKTRCDLASFGQLKSRFFIKDWWRARCTLRELLVGKPPWALPDRLAILDELIDGQQRIEHLEDDAAQQVGRQAFSSMWRGADSDWPALAALADWERACREAGVPEDFRQTVAGANLPQAQPLAAQLAAEAPAALEELRRLFDSVELDVASAFGVGELDDVPLDALLRRLALWRENAGRMTQWVAYCVRWRRLFDEQLDPLAEGLDNGGASASDAVDLFDAAYYEALLRKALRRFPELAEFDGLSHEQALQRFQQLDERRLALARQEVAAAHYQGLPRGVGSVGEVGLVRRETTKKRRHLPLRKLLASAGRAVQAIKPVFMMSPISVAQYLEPGRLDFDLLLIDEASQVRPVDALGAIARSSQIVVVGDDRQLPPTRFFNKLMGDTEDNDDTEDLRTADLESILGLCAAQNMPRRLLRWHYRSRHPSLIAVSNREFYDDKLLVPPSPACDGSNSGLKFRFVREGQFDRGGAAINLREAQRVADAVAEHAARCQDSSLGVGAFSVSQRDAILEELELRRRHDPALEAFCAADSDEPFFVKNLENIQGDERDVIFISVGYAKDAAGRMSMHFGPLSNEGGERRLNVLITRARERCEVFSSVTAADIDLNRARARGAGALKTFLAYAETGDWTETPPADDPEHGPLLAEVADALADRGFRALPQAGAAAFFLDLAVECGGAGRYAFGITTDGPSYRSCESARDRDRLRQQILEARGWKLHRIWAADWFQRPQEELGKLVAALETAPRPAEETEDVGPRLANEPAAEEDADPELIERCGPPSGDDKTAGSVDVAPYVEADFDPALKRALHATPPRELAKVVTKVVKIEGPVHHDEIIRRVAALCGLHRTGRRISDAVETALCEAKSRGKVSQRGEFFSPPEPFTPPIRNREQVASATLRRPEFLPPAEIEGALISVAAAHLGVRDDEAIVEAARLLGFNRATAALAPSSPMR